MMSSSSGRNIRFPFTASQWQELEHQALVFKYMVSGIPIPPDLLFSITRTFHSSSLSSNLLPQHIGWNSSRWFEMGGYGRKIDPEPGRCRRTDGKKWRCSKDAYPDSKYCERHMHRGRNRSRKPVEIGNPITKTSTPNFLLPNPFPSQPNFNFNFFTPQPTNISRYGQGMVSDVEHPILSSNAHNDSFSIMGSSHNMAYSSDLGTAHNKIQKHDDHPKKVMHHFLDEWSHKDHHDTQLSISIPNSLHDFFITQKW